MHLVRARVNQQKIAWKMRHETEAGWQDGISAPMTAGEYIKALRERRGWSARNVAEVSGFAPATIYRWENGTSEPNVVLMNAALTALRASPAEQAIAHSLLGAPRKREQERLHGESITWEGWLPSTGDLWHALRARSRLSGTEVARATGVNASSVTHWEQNGFSPGSELADRLFSLYQADADEQKALVSGSVAWHSGQDEPGSRADWEHHVDALGDALQGGRLIAGDLPFLAVEARLWHRCVSDGGDSAYLLARAYERHADWLGSRGRGKEQARYADRVLALLSPQTDYKSTWAGARAQAAECLAGQGKRRAATAMQEDTLATYAGKSRHRALRSLLLREAADWQSASAPNEAFRKAEESGQLAEESGEGYYVDGSRYVLARLCLRAGRAGDALRLLPPPDTHTGLGEAGLQLDWAEAQLAANDKNAARTHLDKAHEAATRFGLSHLLPRMNALARAL